MKLIHSPDVTGNIVLELLQPKRGIALGNGGYLTSRMAVPEAAMDKNHDLVARKDNIWFSWQPPFVQPVAEAHSMQGLAQSKFRLGVLSPDPRHALGATGWGKEVDHAGSAQDFLSNS